MLSRDQAVGAQLRLGLCCQFVDEPDVRFRTTTAAALSKLPRRDARQKLLDLSTSNALAFRQAILVCKRLKIGAFRVKSGLLPLCTHPDHLYGLEELPPESRAVYGEAGRLAREANIRLSFHPDQFVLLGSPQSHITDASFRDLAAHGELAELLGADVINLHAGGGYGDKPKALDRVARNLERLPPQVRERITLENDDRVFHVRDLLPLCRREGVPLTYDVHHHRCLPDGLSLEEATREALLTWNREPLFHISSPQGGWKAANPRVHADLIDPLDFPAEWLGLALTVDVEARLKERAVLDLRRQLKV